VPDRKVVAVKVSAIIVTRGNVDLRPVLDSLPPEWEHVVWSNGGGWDGEATVAVRDAGRKKVGSFDRCTDVGADLSVYGRYAAIEHASGDVIYVQDDDCVVSDPQAIVADWQAETVAGFDGVVCNMPEPWRSQPFYAEHGLVGFGAAFHRDAPKRAFDIFAGYNAKNAPRTDIELGSWPEARPWFLRTCDVVFTTLTPRVLVDVPHESFDYAWDADRMWRQPDHQSERERMLDLVLQVART
jgi:hypothetical protein